MQIDFSYLTFAVIVMIIFVASVGHIMAFTWYRAVTYNWKISRKLIYDMPLRRSQMIRELKNSIHTPLHSLMLLASVSFGAFSQRTFGSFWGSLVITFLWAEIWHYFSHRAFHIKYLHWIHAEHHRSHLNTPFTAVSFSFIEKFIFDIGIIVPLIIIDQYLIGMNFFGIATWFAGYLIINSFSHANYEFRPATYNKLVGKVLTTTTYHSLHHSRYTGNYGLGTRFLDRLFGTEWIDYEKVYDRITREEKPLVKLQDKLDVIQSAD